MLNKNTLNRFYITFNITYFEKLPSLLMPRPSIVDRLSSRKPKTEVHLKVNKSINFDWFTRGVNETDRNQLRHCIRAVTYRP